MEAGTIKPNKALKAMWAGMKDSQGVQRQYSELDNHCRQIVNIWAGLDPVEQKDALQIFADPEKLELAQQINRADRAAGL